MRGTREKSAGIDPRQTRLLFLSAEPRGLKYSHFGHFFGQIVSPRICGAVFYARKRGFARSVAVTEKRYWRCSQNRPMSSPDTSSSSEPHRRSRNRWATISCSVIVGLKPYACMTALSFCSWAVRSSWCILHSLYISARELSGYISRASRMA